MTRQQGHSVATPGDLFISEIERLDVQISCTTAQDTYSMTGIALTTTTCIRAVGVDTSGLILDMEMA
jgi:hypothetical protein